MGQEFRLPDSIYRLHPKVNRVFVIFITMQISVYPGRPSILAGRELSMVCVCELLAYCAKPISSPDRGSRFGMSILAELSHRPGIGRNRHLGLPQQFARRGVIGMEAVVRDCADKYHATACNQRRSDIRDADFLGLSPYSTSSAPSGTRQAAR
jgi:hypothetical protein